MRDIRPRYILLLAMLAVLGVFASSQLVLANCDEDEPAEKGPEIVILDELENEYEPVPFDHLAHAQMAQMWHGCVTCHHYSPHPEDASSTATIVLSETPRQEESAQFPACSSCHEVGLDESEITMPGLKGAYHRQCLNCHKEWMHENACVICHEPKDSEVEPMQPTSGDIVGRMHPPIPEPGDVYYKTRFTPADGGNVLFRHQEHTTRYDIRCVDCHFEDNCSHCHGSEGDTTAQKPLKPGMTWDESHGPCMACHKDDRCQHCHFHDETDPPPMFSHEMTGQVLDEDHVEIACSECHMNLRCDEVPSCGGVACHNEKPIEYPTDLPGPVLTPTPSPTPLPPVRGTEEADGQPDAPAAEGGGL
ncbi:cytochrome c family protein [bacterium]|nr:cytochrome c family protein [bacterium]